MIQSRLTTAEVIQTYKAYDESTDDIGRELPHGIIRVRINLKGSRQLSYYAMPLSPYETDIPKLGEMVTILKSIGPYNSGTKDNIQHYYTRTVNVQNLLFENKLPDAFRITAQPPEKDIDKTLQIAFEVDPESENKTPKVQPYEGDRIFESRFGSIIRFSSSNTKDTELIKYQTKNTLWTPGKENSPILMITNGIDLTKESYTIENPKMDKSLIYLTSDQKINIDTSQNKIGLGTIAVKNYDKSQIILSADRLLFNSREDYLILSGKKSVNIATPDWQMDMNKFFDLFESFLDEVIKTARGESNYLTGVGPTGGNPTLLAGAQRIKTELFRMRQ